MKREGRISERGIGMVMAEEAQARDDVTGEELNDEMVIDSKQRETKR